MTLSRPSGRLKAKSPAGHPGEAWGGSKSRVRTCVQPVQSRPLIYVPTRLLSWSGIARPAAIGAQQVAGIVIGAAGAAVALWCIFTFAVVGRGTPAPLDPPRRLVIRGPYSFMRNPM